MANIISARKKWNIIKRRAVNPIPSRLASVPVQYHWINVHIGLTIYIHCHVQCQCRNECDIYVTRWKVKVWGDGQVDRWIGV